MQSSDGSSSSELLSDGYLPYSYQFHTSSMRDEPRTPRAPGAARYDPLNVLAPEQRRPTHDPAYARFVQRSRAGLIPGVLADGRMTATHPLVDAYLQNSPSVDPADGRKLVEAWWMRGVRPPTVSEVLGAAYKLNNIESECVFALAALKVLHHPMHPKHFTFWGKHPANKTAERVQKVLDLVPCPIDSPIGWIGIRENLWFVEGLQLNLFPQKKEGKKANNGMLLRKRKEQAGGAAAAEDIEERPRKRTRATKAADNAAPSTVQDVSVPATTSLTSPLATPPQARVAVTRSHKLIDLEEQLPTPSTQTGSSASPAVTRKSARTATTSPAPEPARRSARRNKLVEPDVNASIAAPDDVTLTPTSSPQVDDVASGPAIARARSNSTSGASSNTAVSDTRFASVETVVEAEPAVEAKTGQKRKRGAEKVIEEIEVEEKKTRTSGRVRKPAAKVQKDAVEPEVEEKASPSKRKAVAPPPSKRSRPAKKRA